MKIQIYHNKNYIPFNLYINSIYNIFKNNEFFITNKFEVSIINNISEYSNESDFLILYLNYIADIYNINTKNTKVILIHADYIINHSANDQYLMCNYINNKNLHNSYLWEYNYLNIDYYNKNFKNKKWTFIPLQYNNYLENIYKKYKLTIPFDKKPIDILFMGAVVNGSRRGMILEKISKKHKLFIINHVDDIGKYINIIENSKIVLQIYSNENNMPFDYYRLALLYSNKVFVIGENFKGCDYNNEKQLSELSEVIIKTDYNNILNTIEKYLNKSNSEIETITNETYEIFKKNDMDSCIINFFKKFEN
jgi:hypothetical protein